MNRYGTRRVWLRAADHDDYDALYALENDPESLGTWRYRGAIPATEEYETHLWAQTAAIQVVVSRATGELLGYCQLYDVDSRAGNAWFSVYAGPDHRGFGLVMEGCMAFLEWVFMNWPARWVYAHALEANWDGFGSAVRRAECDDLGVLRERAIVDGEPHDVHVLGIQREKWLVSPVRLLTVRAMASARRDLEAEAGK